jgi:hypothetical protein
MHEPHLARSQRVDMMSVVAERRTVGPCRKNTYQAVQAALDPAEVEIAAARE